MADESTLITLLANFEAEGFTHDMYVTTEAMVRCGSCRTDSAPADLELHQMRRVEGASDPGDMAAVLGVTCPKCGEKGTAVVRFGPEAEAQDGEVLAALVDERF